MALRHASLMHAISNSRHSSKGKAGTALSVNALWGLLLLTTALLLLSWQAVQLRHWQPSAAYTDSSSLQEGLQEAAAGATAAAAAAAAAANQDDEPAPAPGVQRIAYPVWWHAPFYSGTGEQGVTAFDRHCVTLSTEGSSSNGIARYAQNRTCLQDEP
jgi:hypothetical protein